MIFLAGLTILKRVRCLGRLSGWGVDPVVALHLKLILLLLVSTDTWQTAKYARVQRLRDGLQNGGHRDPLVSKLQQHLVLFLSLKRSCPFTHYNHKSLYSTIISSNSRFSLVYQTQGLWYCIEICRLSEILTINADNSEGAIF